SESDRAAIMPSTNTNRQQPRRQRLSGHQLTSRVSLGLKRVLTTIAEPTVPSFDDSLRGGEVYVLYGGVILYLLAVQGFEQRALHRADRFQMARILLLVALIPVAGRLSAFGALALLVMVTIAVIIAQSIRTRQLRKRVRTSRLKEQRELEAEETQWRRRHQ
ncbi:low temperature requirement protein A, partial [Micromonospora sp. ATA32]|nr:low temperature requirement protein A [Micromonospora sp. ATA32]